MLLGRGGDVSNTKAFPSGFKMISGDSRVRSYDSSTMTYLNTRPVADRYVILSDTSQLLLLMITNFLQGKFSLHR